MNWMVHAKGLWILALLIPVLDILYKILYYLCMIKTLPISKARQDLATLVQNANKKLDEYIITVNGTPAAVLMSTAEYESWKETNEIMSDPQLMTDIKQGQKEIAEGKGIPWEEAKKELGLD